MPNIEKQQNDWNGRVSAYVSPEAKAMLREMAKERFPNLHRPIGSMLERLIREEWQKRQEQKK